MIILRITVLTVITKPSFQLETVLKTLHKRKREGINGVAATTISTKCYRIVSLFILFSKSTEFQLQKKNVEICYKRYTVWRSNVRKEKKKTYNIRNINLKIGTGTSTKHNAVSQRLLLSLHLLVGYNFQGQWHGSIPELKWVHVPLLFDRQEPVQLQLGASEMVP